MASKTVSVAFRALTDEFEKKVGSAGNKLQNFGKTAAVAVGGFLAAKVSVDKFMDRMESLDKLGKLSDKLNIDPNSLRGLQLGAELSGVSMESLEGGIQKMLITLGKAIDGSKQAQDAFTDLGFSVEEMGSLSTEQVFSKIADAISKIEDPAKRADALVRIFGKSGTDLTAVLAGGSEGIREFIKEAERINGGVITRDDLKNVEAANDAMTTLNSSVNAIVDTFVISFAPAIKDVTQLLADAITELASFLKAGQEVFEEFFSNFYNIDEEIFNNVVDVGKYKRDSKVNVAAVPTDTIKTMQEVSTKGFTDALQFGSRGAFAALNPDIKTVQEKIAENTKATAEAVKNLANKAAIAVVEEI